jgi:Rrf2 family protein
MLSQKAKYALRALIHLAQKTGDGKAGDEVVSIGEIAAEENVPHKFLEVILSDLRRFGLVESRRGKRGGYRLARPAGEIAIGDVVRLIDGPLAPLRCASQTKFEPCADCRDVETCEVRWLMRDVRDAIADVLDQRTLGDALGHRLSARAAAHYEI